MRRRHVSAGAKMTDLEITRLCAEAMGYLVEFAPTELPIGIAMKGGGQASEDLYDPLHDDAQAMALVKKVPMTIEPPVLSNENCWHVESVNIVNGICPDIYDA